MIPFKVVHLYLAYRLECTGYNYTSYQLLIYHFNVFKYICLSSGNADRNIYCFVCNLKNMTTFIYPKMYKN